MKKLNGTAESVNGLNPSRAKRPSENNTLQAGLWPIAATWAVILAANITNIVLIVASPNAPIYDEGYYIATLSVVHEFGILFDFLAHFPGPPGPTFTWTYALFEQMFGIVYPWIRFASYALFLASIISLSTLLARSRQQGIQSLLISPALLAMFLTALPSAAVSAGMTLTEVPALFFICLFLWLLLGSFSHGQMRSFGSLACAAFSGIALSLAILGRQNYVVVLACLPLLASMESRIAFRRDIAFLAVPIILTLAMVGPIFLLWGGLVPPQWAKIGGGYALWYAVLAGAYAGIAALLLAPEFYRPLLMRRGLVLAVGAASLVMAALFGENSVPLRSLIESAGLTSLLFVAGKVVSFTVAALGLSFMTALALDLQRNYKKALPRFAGASLFLGLLSIGGITHQFSSRYVFVFFPFLLLILAEHARASWHMPVRAALGGALGAASLASYFRLV